MSVERCGTVLLMNKKNYVHTGEGEIKHKGISVVSEDRVPYVNTVVELVWSAAAARAPALGYPTLVPGCRKAAVSQTATHTHAGSR